MNCSTCRYELSQCLDGRLPSGRRSLVMQHVEQCRDCSDFWNELQAAQQLILQLPREHVGSGFRDQLFERIRAGEGTPDAVFREPVPLWAKVRYAFTGAAAAAVLLAAALWLRGSDPQGLQPLQNHVATPEQPDARGEGVAHTVGTDAMLAHGAPSFYDNPLMAATQRLTTDVVALEA